MLVNRSTHCQYKNECSYSSRGWQPEKAWEPLSVLVVYLHRCGVRSCGSLVYRSRRSRCLWWHSEPRLRPRTASCCSCSRSAWCLKTQRVKQPWSITLYVSMSRTTDENWLLRTLNKSCVFTVHYACIANKQMKCAPFKQIWNHFNFKKERCS